MKTQASIICCVYNEENVLKLKLINTLDFFNKNNRSKQINDIIFIDNCSTDGSKKLIKSINKKKFQNLKVKFIFNKKNIGKGGSIKKAVNKSRSNYCAIFDLDEYEASDILNGLKKIKKNKNRDFLIGYRISKNTKFIYYTNYLGVKFLSFLFSLIYKEKVL